MSIKSLLKIPKDYKIKRIEEAGDEIHIKLEPYKRKKIICSGCGQEHSQGYHGSLEVKVRDFPIAGQKVYLHVLKRRCKCPVDGKIYVEAVDWIKKKEDIPRDILLRYTV